MAHELEPLAIRQPHVRQAQVEARLLKARLGFTDRAGQCDADAHLYEGELEELADIRLIVHHQHSAFPGRRDPIRFFHAVNASSHTILKCPPGVSST